MGYANVRLKTHKLKPVKKRGHGCIWIVAVVLVVGLVAFCHLRRTRICLRMKEMAVDVADGEVRENYQSMRLGFGKRSCMPFDLGDYSDFRDVDFCKQYGVDTANVRQHYDSHRNAAVYTYTSKALEESVSDLSIKTVVQCDECSNRIVSRSVISVMTPEGDRGTIEFKRGCHTMAETVIKELSAFSTFSCPANYIVASTPNITYRGHDKELTERNLISAVGDVSGHGGVVAIQWETPTCFVSWYYMDHKGVCMLIGATSDRLVRDELFGNE